MEGGLQCHGETKYCAISSLIFFPREKTFHLNNSNKSTPCHQKKITVCVCFEFSSQMFTITMNNELDTHFVETVRSRVVQQCQYLSFYNTRLKYI